VLTLRAAESGHVSEPAPTSASSASSAVEPWARSTCGRVPHPMGRAQRAHPPHRRKTRPGPRRGRPRAFIACGTVEGAVSAVVACAEQGSCW